VKQYGLKIIFLLLCFCSFSVVKASESGTLGDYQYHEVERSTDYFKIELSNGKIILGKFDTSKNAGVANRMKEQILNSSFHGKTISRETRFLSVSNDAFKTYEANSKYYSKPTRGDFAAFLESPDATELSISNFQVYLVEVVDAKVPVFAHVIHGMDDFANSNGAVIQSIRFVQVNLIQEEEDDEEEESNHRVEQNTEQSKVHDDVSVPSAGTTYCSDPNFIKPFKFLGRIFTILKILIPIIIIGFGAFDLSKAVVASKDDEIKKSIRSLAMRALAGIIIFFVPTIVNLVFTLVDDWNQYSTDYSKCSRCISNPGKC